jgi:serine/threonine protein kinase
MTTVDLTNPDNLVGTKIFGDYLIRKKLGEGGMGAVFLAEHKSIDQRLAIKVLHGDAAQNPELVERFNREARAIARLTNQNIIRVFVFGRTPEGLLYLAMEFVEGKPLRDLIEKENHLSELRAISVMRQTLHALNEAHELGIVHRDLKPDNIMITRFRGVEEFVKVLDFGIAKVKEPNGQQAKLTQAGVVYGTPEYLSPEQAQAKELDGRSDLYSMGIILYEMITGTVPFQSKTAVTILAAHVYDPPDPPSKKVRFAISPRMERIIMKALEKDPNKRYQTAMAFLEDLETLEAELSGGAATKTTVLDASQVAALIGVSRVRQAQADAPAAPAPAPAAATRPAAPPPSAPTVPIQHTQANVPSGAPAGNNMTVFIAVIVCLALLLVMAGIAIFVLYQRANGAA